MRPYPTTPDTRVENNGSNVAFPRFFDRETTNALGRRIHRG
jgi:hypothetical protein